MWIPIVLGGLMGLFLIVVMLQPNDLRVSRSQKMAAPASKVFEQVNDLRLMNAWNPWVKLDPNLRQTYEGAETGVGAIYSWDGNKNVGAGRQTIVESRPNDLVRLKLEFFRPFAGVNDVEFTFVPEGNETVVTWNMQGKLNFMTKAIGVFMSMEKMCGNSFEKGLTDLKALVEA